MSKKESDFGCKFAVKRKSISSAFSLLLAIYNIDVIILWRGLILRVLLALILLQSHFLLQRDVKCYQNVIADNNVAMRHSCVGKSAAMLVVIVHLEIQSLYSVGFICLNGRNTDSNLTDHCCPLCYYGKSLNISEAKIHMEKKFLISNPCIQHGDLPCAAGTVQICFNLLYKKAPAISVNLAPITLKFVQTMNS